MRKHISHMFGAVLVGAVAVGCSGHEATDNQQAQNERTRGLGQTVKVEGCVQAAPGPNRFTLHEVSFTPSTSQPTGNEAVEPAVISEGSWIRLAPGSDNLNSYLGKRVAVTGVIRDTGANTLATSGHLGSDHDKFARSSRDSGTNPDRNMKPTTAVPAGADANGDAPLVAVNSIQKLSDTCEAR